MLALRSRGVTSSHEVQRMTFQPEKVAMSYADIVRKPVSGGQYSPPHKFRALGEEPDALLSEANVSVADMKLSVDETSSVSGDHTETEEDQTDSEQGDDVEEDPIASFWRINMDSQPEVNTRSHVPRDHNVDTGVAGSDDSDGGWLSPGEEDQTEDDEDDVIDHVKGESAPQQEEQVTESEADEGSDSEASYSPEIPAWVKMFKYPHADETEAADEDEDEAPALPPRSRQPVSVTYEPGHGRVYTYPTKEYSAYWGQRGVTTNYAREEQEENFNLWEDSDDDMDSCDVMRIGGGAPKTVSDTYVFPRRGPRKIGDVVAFWEMDFQVGGVMVPRMGSWAAKGLAPAVTSPDHARYLRFQRLYEKWRECHCSREQWAERYWGRSLTRVLTCRPAQCKVRAADLCDGMRTV